MHIEEIRIENFKCFKNFDLKLNEGLNILVGDNEAGKSTILEAINLALTGLFNGRYLKNDLTQYLFNNDVISEYVKKTNNGELVDLPSVTIELTIAGEDLPKLEGDGNAAGQKKMGISYKIGFNEKYKDEYQDLVKGKNVITIPIEYYDIFWTTYARENITAISIPLKPAFIDSASNRYRNGSDVYISRIVKDILDEKDKVNISQAHRRMIDTFVGNESIIAINQKLKEKANISNKKVELSVELSSKNAWESSLITFFDDVPFHFIGKGEQCIVKTNLALSHDKNKEANVLLLEEPENHLSHTKLNQLINEIKERNSKKQIIISTHSSFVANKLGLESLILLSIDENTKDRTKAKLSELSATTQEYFEKLAGYDTLRLLLSKKTILVEGDSDELIVQKAFIDTNKGKLPIEECVEVISVGTSFLRFLEIADKIKKTIVVVTDNDGKPAAVKKKYANYLGDHAPKHVKICFSEDVALYSLEPQIVDANKDQLDLLRTVIDVKKEDYPNADSLIKYMEQTSNKTDCALSIFKTKEKINFPQYILDALK